MNRVFVILIFLSFSFVNAQKDKGSSQFKYFIELNNNPEDVVKVRLKIEDISLSKGIYQFVSSVPGTYQILDIGRFVKNFKAFNKNGEIIKTKKISTNQWKVSEPSKTKEIYYEISDTWDTEVKGNFFDPFFGMSLEKDHALINSYTVIGYFEDFRNANYRLYFSYPESWVLGSQFKTNKEEYFEFSSFDQVADTPFLFGKLSKELFEIEGTSFTIYTYSQNDKITSEKLKPLLEEAFKAEKKFMRKFPVDHYTFLFHFDNGNINGALEYNNASVYTLVENDLNEDFSKLIVSDAVHEFLHLVTPLNLRSEIIKDFNFINPKASKHIWFYEGVTEWGSDISLMRGGVCDINYFLSENSAKLDISEKFDKNYNLSEASLNCYSEEGRLNFPNVYNRGHLVASLLDILILDLSNGKKGLREILLELDSKYSKSKPFKEEHFFTEFTKMTYPQIGEFLTKYVKNAEKLPIRELYEKIGIKYTEEYKTGNKIASVGFELFVPDGKIKIRDVSSDLKKMGLMDSDELLAFNEIETRLDNTSEWVGKISNLKFKDDYTLKVNRGEQLISVKCKVIAIDEVKKHLFKIIENPSKEQTFLQESWMKNL